jgi:hypothetical protein
LIHIHDEKKKKIAKYRFTSKERDTKRKQKKKGNVGSSRENKKKAF